MWKPAEKIRFTAKPENWPDKDAALASKLFSSLSVGNLELNHRTWVPAMVPWRATEQGDVTQDVIDWYARFAEGQPGAIVVEATGIRDVASGPLLRIGHDRYIDGLSKVVQAVREKSKGHTKIYIQLIDFLNIRRRPKPEKYFERFLKITEDHRKRTGFVRDEEIRDFLASAPKETLAHILSEREYESLERGYRERVTDTELEHIRDLPKVLPGLFSDAALRAKQAGFDGVELHYAHAYTMASFLSRLNTREDGYGATLEGRKRLPLEVYEAVRLAVGTDYTVGCRMLSEDCVKDGTTLNDAVDIAVSFAGAGMDFLSFSRGGKFEDAAQPNVGQAIYPYTGQSGYECMPHFISDEAGPFGRNIDPTAAIKHALKAEGYATPVVVAGGIHDFEQAESILKGEQADIIGIARQALADPDWFRKVFTGQGEAVNVCKYSNYCEGLDQKHKVVTCQLWDRLQLDDEDVDMTLDGKRRKTAPKWRKK